MVLVYSIAGRRDDYSLRKRQQYRLDAIEPGLSEEVNLGLGFGLLQAMARVLDLPRLWQYCALRCGIVPARLLRAVRDADLVVSDLSYTPPIRGLSRHQPWYLISHQLEHRLLQQASALHRHCAARIMRRIESTAPARYRDIFACAEEDRAFFRAHDASGLLRVPIIRCAVDSSAYVPQPGARRRVRKDLGVADEDVLLVFSGSHFGPNLAALERLKAFARAEAAFLRQHRILFLVLGSIEPVAYREGSLIATGRVPEVVSYLAAADAGFNPVTTGAGANVKLFEYLAARLPVISTEFGVRGSGLRAEADFVPYSPDDPKTALIRFVTERTPAQWKQHAEEVWSRHKGSCDIAESVRAAVAQARDFPPA